MAAFFERKKEKINIADKIIESPSIDLTEVQNRIDATNDEANDQAVIERTEALKKIGELEKKTGVNMDATESAIARQIQALKEAGAKFHARMKKVMSVKERHVSAKEISIDDYLESYLEDVNAKRARGEKVGAVVEESIREEIKNSLEAKRLAEAQNEKYELLKKEAEEIKNSLIRHIDSQEYLGKLKIEFNGDDGKALACQKKRKENLESVGFGFLSRDQMDKYNKERDAEAMYDPAIHYVFLQGGEKQHVSTTHEFIHASMRGEGSSSEKSIKVLHESFIGIPGYSNWDEYLSDYEERIAFKQKTDLIMEELGIKKYGEEFNDEHYNKLMKYYDDGKGDLPLDVKIFIKTTKPQDFKRIFNEIADKSMPGDEVDSENVEFVAGTVSNEKTKKEIPLSVLEDENGLNLGEFINKIAEELKRRKAEDGEGATIDLDKILGRKNESGSNGKKSKKKQEEEFVKVDENKWRFEAARGDAQMIREELIAHVGSGEYLEKLEKEYGGDVSRASRIQELRVSMLENVRINVVSEKELYRKYAEASGRKFSGIKGISGFCTSSGEDIYITSDDVVYGMTTAIHELLHASTKVHEYISKRAKSLLKESFRPANDGRDDYFKDPTERLARKQVLDRDLDMLKIKKYGERFTDKHFEQMMQYYKLGFFSEDSTDFIKRTDPSYFKQIFNEIAEVEIGNKDKVAA